MLGNLHALDAAPLLPLAVSATDWPSLPEVRAVDPLVSILDPNHTENISALHDCRPQAVTG